MFSNRNSLDPAIKLKVLQTIVLPVWLYGCETWALTQETISKLHTFRMRFIRTILGVSQWHKIVNEENVATASKKEIPYN